MKTVDIRGYIITNELKDVADFYGIESTAPNDLKSVIDSLDEGEDLNVTINSGGGYLTAGQEMYTMLLNQPNVTIYVNSIAASAASLIAMGGTVIIMSPAAQLMIHNVQVETSIDGDWHDADRLARDLKSANEAIAEAYSRRTGMSKDKALALMDRETWLSAEKAVELNFADSIMDPAEVNIDMAAAIGSLPLTDKMIEQARKDMAEAKRRKAEKEALVSDLWKYGI